jgi:hypothetical protein
MTGSFPSSNYDCTFAEIQLLKGECVTGSVIIHFQLANIGISPEALPIAMTHNNAMIEESIFE